MIEYGIETVGGIFFFLGMALFFWTAFLFAWGGNLNIVKKKDVARAIQEHDFSTPENVEPEYCDIGEEEETSVYLWCGEHEEFDEEYEGERLIGEHIEFSETGLEFAGLQFAYDEITAQLDIQRFGRRVYLRLCIDTISDDSFWVPFDGKACEILRTYPIYVVNIGEMEYLLEHREDAFRQILKYGKIKRIKA